MYLKYKLPNGYIINLFAWDLLEEEAKNKDEYWKGKSGGYILTDSKNKKRIASFTTDILKDKEKNKFYFEIYGNKIYISDFEYLGINDLYQKLANKENIPFDIFIVSLIKNIDNVAFIEDREELSYSGAPIHKKVLCIPVEKYYKKEHWTYKIETEPLDEYEKATYGRKERYVSDFYNAIYTDKITLIPKDQIKDNNLLKEKSYVKKLKKD